MNGMQGKKIPLSSPFCKGGPGAHPVRVRSHVRFVPYRAAPRSESGRQRGGFVLTIKDRGFSLYLGPRSQGLTSGRRAGKAAFTGTLKGHFGVDVITPPTSHVMYFLLNEDLRLKSRMQLWAPLSDKHLSFFIHKNKTIEHSVFRFLSLEFIAVSESLDGYPMV
jgi:hypothetical protein